MDLFPCGKADSRSPCQEMCHLVYHSDVRYDYRKKGHWSLFLATCCSLLSLFLATCCSLLSLKYSLQLNVFWLMFCLFIISTTHATCPARLAVCLVNLTMCDAVHKLWSFCLRHFFRPPAASCLTVSKVPPALVLKDPEYLLFFQCKSSSFTCA